VPSLAPAGEDSLSLTPSPEIVGAAAYVIPGLLPASTLYPAASGVYPLDNVNVAAVDGPVLTSVSDDSLTLTPLSED
jgi:hypothetical protein